LGLFPRWIQMATF